MCPPHGRGQTYTASPCSHPLPDPMLSEENGQFGSFRLESGKDSGKWRDEWRPPEPPSWEKDTVGQLSRREERWRWAGTKGPGGRDTGQGASEVSAPGHCLNSSDSSANGSESPVLPHPPAFPGVLKKIMPGEGVGRRSERGTLREGSREHPARTETPKEAPRRPTPIFSCSPLTARQRVEVSLLSPQSSRERGAKVAPPSGMPKETPCTPLPLPHVPPSPSPQGLSGCPSLGCCEHGGWVRGGALHSGEDAERFQGAQAFHSQLPPCFFPPPLGWACT